MRVFARSPNNSLSQCSCEIGIEKSSVNRILRAQKWKPYIARLIHVRCRCLEYTVEEGGHFEIVQA